MKHLRHLLTAFALCLLLGGSLCLPVSAESAASGVDLVCTVNADGDCRVTMTVMLRLEAIRDQLTYPLPLEAKSISMNGNSVTPQPHGFRPGGGHQPGHPGLCGRRFHPL